MPTLKLDVLRLVQCLTLHNSAYVYTQQFQCFSVHNNCSVSLYTIIPVFLHTQQRQRLSVIGSVYLCKVHQHFSYGTDHCLSPLEWRTKPPNIFSQSSEQRLHLAGWSTDLITGAFFSPNTSALQHMNTQPDATFFMGTVRLPLNITKN